MSEYTFGKSCKDDKRPYCRQCSSIIHAEWIKSKPPEYTVWTGMKQRCGDPNQVGYKNYGGKGVTICERWLEHRKGFSNFLEDMGPRPTDDHQIDRINNGGNYEPSNCRWASITINARNKRNNVINMSDAKTMRWLFDEGICRQVEIAQIWGVSHEIVYQVVRRIRWKEQA